MVNVEFRKTDTNKIRLLAPWLHITDDAPLCSERISALLVDSDGSGFLGSDQGTVAAFSLSSVAVERRYEGIEGSAVQSLALSSDGTMLIASGSEGEIAVWRRQTGESVWWWEAGSSVVQTAILGAGRYVTRGGNGNVRVWRQQREGAGQAMLTRDEDGDPINCDAFGVLAESLVLLAGFEWVRFDIERQTVVDRATPVRGTRLLHLDGLIGLTRSGRYYYVYWDEFVLYDIVRREIVRREPFLDPMSAAALTEDGQTLALGGKTGSILFLDEKWKAMAEHRGTAKVREMAFSPDGSLLAFVDANADGGVVSTKTGELLASP
jgi:WD40 repeat protein